MTTATIAPPRVLKDVQDYDIWLLFNVARLIQLRAMGDYYAALVLGIFDLSCKHPQTSFDYQLQVCIDRFRAMWPDGEGV